MLSLAELMSYEGIDEENPTQQRIKVRVIPTNTFTIAYLPLSQFNQFKPPQGSIILIYQPNDFTAFYVTTIRDPEISLDPKDYGLLTNLSDKLEEGDFNFTSGSNSIIVKRNSGILLKSGTSTFSLTPQTGLLNTTNAFLLSSPSIIIKSLLDPTLAGSSQIELSYEVGVIKSDLLLGINGINIKYNLTGSTIEINLSKMGCTITAGQSSVKINSAGDVVIDGVSVKLGKGLKKLLTEEFLKYFEKHVHTSSAPGSPTSTPMDSTQTPITASTIESQVTTQKVKGE